jgi:hypothetical protein
LENKNVASEMKKILIGLLTVAVVGGILFSGCVAPPPEAPVTSPETTPEVTPIPWPTDPNSVLISYEHSAAFVGLDDELTIYANGRCELRHELRVEREFTEREFTIQSSQLAHLKELMEEANFLDLKLPPTPPIPDVGQYVISYYAGEGKMNTVRINEIEIPDALLPIIHELKQIISSNS